MEISELEKLARLRRNLVADINSNKQTAEMYKNHEYSKQYLLAIKVLERHLSDIDRDFPELRRAV